MLSAVTALSLSVSGCIGSQGPRVMTVKSSVPAEQSFVGMAPGGPAIVGVLEKRYKDAITRETILATTGRTPGENFIFVTLYGPTGHQTVGDNALGTDSITPSQINKEFGWYLYGIPMKRSLLYVQNKYGAFGFATGVSSAGERCIYAWQQIGRHQDRLLLLEVGTIGIRLRVCDPHATDEQLLAIMYGFTITGYLNSPRWNPYGAPPKVSENLGGLAAPMYPEYVTPPAVSAPVPAPPRKRRAAAPVDDDSVSVPLPTATDLKDYAKVPAPGT